MVILQYSKIKIWGILISFIISIVLSYTFYEKLSQEFVSSLVNFISGLLAVIVTIVILISALDNSYNFYSTTFLKQYKKYYMVPVATLCSFSTYILICIVYGYIILSFEDIPQILLSIFFIFALPILFISLSLPFYLYKFIESKYDELIEIKQD